jgi:regulator of replication initiation timing
MEIKDFKQAIQDIVKDLHKKELKSLIEENNNLALRLSIA